MAPLIRDFHPDVIRGFALPAEVSPPPPSDGSGPDVRRRLHGGRRLSTHLPDHRQLPAVPPTQTLALRITLHEHAQRRECGFPGLIRGHPSIPSIHITARRLAGFLGPQEQRQKNWWIR